MYVLLQQEQCRMVILSWMSLPWCRKCASIIKNGMLPRSDCWRTECYLVRVRLACGLQVTVFLLGNSNLCRRFPRIIFVAGGSLSPAVRVLSIAFALVPWRSFVFSRLGTYSLGGRMSIKSLPCFLCPAWKETQTTSGSLFYYLSVESVLILYSS